MNEPEPNIPALRREWLAAQVAASIAVLALLAVGGMLLIGRPPTILQASHDAGSPISGAAGAENAQGEELCRAAFMLAKNFGVIPAQAKISTEAPQATETQGRYICDGANDATKYSLAFDLMCRNTNDEHCINLYSVTGDDGKSLFQRQD